MADRVLPPRPNLDHLKNEAKALHAAFGRGDPAAVTRVQSVLGSRRTLKLTEAQRVVAREYGFATWAKLRTHVQSLRGIDEAIDAFLGAVMEQDRERATQALEIEPRIASESLHAAAVLGRVDDVRRIVAADPASVHARRGSSNGQPLLWLAYSPFHGENAERDANLAASARVLLEAGADPNAGDRQYNIGPLYAVTGVHNVPRIARMLLEAGANVNDGESAFHAAERNHVEALELLREFGVDLNKVGDWGNTPLYFLLKYHDIEDEPQVKRGVLWLLDHGADPNVRCGKEQETCLHISIRERQEPSVVQLLLDRGADVHAKRGDGRSAWILARRMERSDVVEILERAGARAEPLDAEDLLVGACARGDVAAAGKLALSRMPELIQEELVHLMIVSARAGKLPIVQACLAAGCPIGATDESNATALHHACIDGRANVARELLKRGADHTIRDPEHHSTPLGWAVWGADYHRQADGDYAETVRLLLEAGARPDPNDYHGKHPGVAAVLREYDANTP